MRFILITVVLFTVSFSYSQDINYPTPEEGDYMVNDFKFSSGESLDTLRLHYVTIGKPEKDKKGQTKNAVLIMHGTTGSSQQFLSEKFAGYLFGPGQLLDATKYFIILTDDIGHGKSSKPSDGLHMKFPKYNYDDMVLANYKLLTEHLGVNHLRLAMGTSMGGMHTWVWGYTYPEFMDALMPLASLPVEIAGRNWIQRKMLMELIKMDPEWKGGEYKKQPRQGLTAAISIMMTMGSAPLKWQKLAPTKGIAEGMMDEMMKRYFSILDANDMIYAFNSARNYDPSPHLSKIRAPLLAINSADDEINPPELNILEEKIKNVPHGEAIILPITEKTSGHGTHSDPKVWDKYLREFLKLTAKD